VSVFSERPSSNAVGQDAEHGAELLTGILAVEPDHLDGVPVDVGMGSWHNNVLLEICQPDIEAQGRIAPNEVLAKFISSSNPVMTNSSARP